MFEVTGAILFYRPQILYKISVSNITYLNHKGDPGVDGRIILRLIFRKWVMGVWTGSSWLRIGTGGGHL
jgi:hypothetical protein